MSSAGNAADADRVRNVIMSRVARLVLPDEGGIDRRDAMMLVECGIIRPGADLERESPLGGISQSESTAPVRGPVLIVTRGDGGRHAVRLRDLLLSEHQQDRQYALESLEQVGRDEEVVSGQTRQTLAATKAMASAAGPDWRRAAMNLVDVIDRDLKFSVAGARQCRPPELQELWSGFVTAAVRPTLSGIQECSPSFLSSVFHIDAMKSFAAGLVSGGNRSTEAVCTEYLAKLGHVPLGAELALSRVLAEGHRLPDQIGEVLGWGSGSGQVGARYHACEAALSVSSKLTPEQRNIVSEWFWEIVCPVRGVENPTEAHAAWTLASQVARYYVQYLELRVPTDHGDTLAALAWWLAQRLIAACGSSVAELRHLGEQLDTSNGSVCAATWDLLGPPMIPSVLRWLTLFGPSPWSVALIAAIRTAEDMRWLLNGPGAGAPSDRTTALTALSLQISNLTLDDRSYGFSNEARRALGWAASLYGDPGMQAAAGAWAEGIDWSPEDSLATALETIHKQESATQQWMALGIRQRVGAGQLNGDGLWKIVSADSWMPIWVAMSPFAVQALGCALLDHAARIGPDWWPEVPHLIGRVAEQRSDVEGDRPAMFGMVARACCTLNSPSALTRLLRGPAGNRYRPLAMSVRANLEQVLNQGGTWASGKLRALLVDLLP